MSQLAGAWKDIRSAMKEGDGKARVPDGVYDCKIASTKVGQTGSGYEKINARFVVLNGPYEGGSLFMDFILTIDKPGGLSLFGDRLQSLGISPEMLTDDLNMDGLAKMLLDRTAQVTLATRVYNGKEYDDVKALKPLAPGSGFAFGSGLPSIPGTATGPLNLITNMPMAPTPAVPPVPMPVVDATPPLPVPVPVPADGDNGLPPEPPF